MIIAVNTQAGHLAVPRDNINIMIIAVNTLAGHLAVPRDNINIIWGSFLAISHTPLPLMLPRPLIAVKRWAEPVA
jgi:hypothetical protein